MARLRLIGVMLVVTGLGVAAWVVPSGAQAPSVFYRASAQANTEFVEVRRPGYILEPILQVNALDTQSTITSTGTRDSLGSLLNPGPIGDFPALLGLAIAGLPPIPYPGYPLTTTASHPLVPESTLGLGDLPGGAADDAVSVRPFTVTARASEDATESIGTGAATSLAAGLIRVGAAESSTRAEEDRGIVTITARTRLAGIDIAGLVEIEGLETETVGTLDGDTVHIESTSTVGAVRALGAELEIDGEGIRVVTILGLPAPPPILLESLTDRIEGLLANLGIELKLIEGTVVEGPADGTTTYENVGAGLQVNVPIVIPADVPIPSLPIPLGIPVGGGIPTNLTVGLGRARVTALAGSGLEIAAPPTPTTVAVSGDAPAAPTTSGGRTTTGSGGLASPAAPTNLPLAPSSPSSGGAAVTPAASVAVAAPDFTPAFRWTLLTALSAIGLGWPLARRRVAGVPGLSASGVLRSLTNAREAR